MNLQTKADFSALMHRFLDPLKPYYSAGCARLHLGDTGVTYNQNAIELEAFSRPLWALVPFWVGGGSDPEFETIYRKGLAAGADPESPEYWGTTGEYDQCYVEMAAIACGILTAPEKLWTPLSDAEKPSQQSGKTKSGDSKAAKDDKPCTAAPDAELSSVDHSDTNLVAQLQLTSNCASTKDGDTAEFKESDVKVSIKDDEGNVIASAVFEFSKQTVKFNGETANVALEFTTRQYWRPYDQIETGSAEVILQTGQSGTGEAGSADGDALAGSDIDSEDAERYAQLALSWQLKHDESAASRFYATYTTQLSSKKNDMKADGKTWHYVDIYEQFLQQRIKHKNAILIWSGDYPTYTKADASTAYYVILSGDTVDSVKAGDAWCKSNGYGAADCAVVDLQ